MGRKSINRDFRENFEISDYTDYGTITQTTYAWEKQKSK